MRLTQEVDYAFRIIATLMKTPREVVGASSISEEMHVPLRFLLKILRKLNQAGLTKSRRGAKGGYQLLDPERVITYYDVVEAIQGPVQINRCLYDEEACLNNMNGHHCFVHARLAVVQDKICNALKEEKFVPHKVEA